MIGDVAERWRWRWTCGDLELRTHFFPAFHGKDMSVGECFTFAVLWRRRCITLCELNGSRNPS